MLLLWCPLHLGRAFSLWGGNFTVCPSLPEHLFCLSGCQQAGALPAVPMRSCSSPAGDVSLWSDCDPLWLCRSGARHIFRAVFGKDRISGQKCCERQYQADSLSMGNILQLENWYSFRRKYLSCLPSLWHQRNAHCPVPLGLKFDPYWVWPVAHQADADDLPFLSSGSLSPDSHWLQLWPFSTFIPMGISFSNLKFQHYIPNFIVNKACKVTLMFS